MQIRKSRFDLANTQAIRSYLPNISRYTFETAVTLGIFLFAAIQFSTTSSQAAIAAIGLFLGASSRIAPSVMRLQQNALTLKSAFGTALPVLTLIDEFKFVSPISSAADSIATEYAGFDARILVHNVSFKYPGSEKNALRNISLELQPNMAYAVVGPSGAGKSTLVDLILGIITPDHGEVIISGISPRTAIQTWPGAIAYLPQNISMINGTISENISAGYPSDESHSRLIDSAIKVAQLSDFVESLPLGLKTIVGDRGTKLSGGQRQRLGIARALFTSPKLLILDEATSALDGQTEEQVSTSILKQEGLTVISVAHRLSTIRRADCIIYMNHGIIEATGTLQEVRKLVPEFDLQIRLMSL
jgi:ABC-type multidrug transport system fused ATPase/permease subunit